MFLEEPRGLRSKIRRPCRGDGKAPGKHRLKGER